MAKINTMTFEQQKEIFDRAFFNMKKRNFSDTKINKLIAEWQPFEMKRSIYITTFQNNVKRALKRDEKGFYFILNKDIERIFDPQEIERINEFLNIK